MIPIPLILGSISALLSLFAAAKTASDSATRGRGGMQQQGMQGQGQGGMPQGALQIPKYGPEGMSALNQLLGSGLQGLQQQGQPSFGPIAENARRDWATHSVPLLAERFGGLGARRSGAYEGILSGAQRQFEGDLRGQEQMFGQQNRNQLLQQLQLGLTSPYESVYKTRQPGFGENLATSALPSLIENAPQLAKMFQEWGSSSAGAK